MNRNIFNRLCISLAIVTVLVSGGIATWNQNEQGHWQGYVDFWYSQLNKDQGYCDEAPDMCDKAEVIKSRANLGETARFRDHYYEKKRFSITIGGLILVGIILVWAAITFTIWGYDGFRWKNSNPP